MFALKGAVEFPHTQGYLYNYAVYVYSSELLLEWLHTQCCLYMSVQLCICVLCAFYLFMCTQVSCCWSGSTLSVVCICLYNYVYVCYVHFICLCVCVYSSELLLELIHTQGCLYMSV